ncbi:MAG: glycosyltransferase [Methylophaga sp.]|nr:glycosyltransferase [Methylophaga sp.]
MASWKGETDQPVVSICCTTFNHEAYIEDALEGFLIQETDFPYEILIHDDASTDRTANIIRDYEAQYPKIIKTIYQTENQFSQGKRINADFNFTRALGDYLAICEGDDYWVDKLKLQKQIHYLMDNPGYVLTFTDAITFDSEGVLDTDFGGAKKDLSAEELIVGTPIKTLTTCFRNVFKNKTWPVDLRKAFYGDLTVWSLLGDHGAAKYMPDISPSMYRVHDAGIHSSTSAKTRYVNYLQTLICLYAHRLNDSNQRGTRLLSIKIIKYLAKDLSILDFLKILINKILILLRFSRK